MQLIESSPSIHGQARLDFMPRLTDIMASRHLTSPSPIAEAIHTTAILKMDTATTRPVLSLLSPLASSSALTFLTRVTYACICLF